MDNLDYKPQYRRNLPHIQPLAATLFVTFRLAGSMPRTALDEARKFKARFDEELTHIAQADERRQRERAYQRERFARLEKILDGAETGPTWLRETPVARLVAKALHNCDGKVYRLEAYCLMPNHVHMVFTPLLVAQADEDCYRSLASIMHTVKSGTAYNANQLLGRTGAFWEHESYDHYVRDERELERIIAYVLDNPVKAGLTADWRAWPWSYCRVPL